VDVGETNIFDFVITDNGVKVLECLCGDGIWRIECCPSKSSGPCSTLQKDTKEYCKVKIISKQTNRGIIALRYVGYWSTTKVYQLSYISFGLFMMTLCVVGKRQVRICIQ
jgi:hypothetical protein